MLNFCSTSYIIAWMTLPFMEVGNVYRIIAILAVLVWCCTIKKINPDVYKNADAVVKIGAVYCVWTFIGKFLLYGLSKAIADTINPFIVVFVFLIYYGYAGTKYFKKIVFVSLVCFLVVGAMSMHKLYLDPRAARDAYTAWNQGDASKLTGIGTYGFIMSSAIMCPLLLAVLTKKGIIKKTKIVFLLLFLILLFMVMMSGYTTANLVMFVGVFVLLCMRNPSPIKTVLMIATLLILLLVWKNVVENILLYLIDKTSNNVTYNTRMHEMYDSFVLGQNAYGDLASREKRYTNTIREIFRNPFFGAALIKGRYSGGGHSDYLDALAAYGVPYFCCHVWVTLVKPLKNIKSRETSAMGWSYAVSTIVLCTLNPYSYIQSIVAVIVMPYIAELLVNANDNRMNMIRGF